MQKSKSIDRGIILGTYPFAEADLIVKILNRNGELKSFIAKSARKSKKRFGGGVLEATHYIEYQYQATSSELSLLTDASVVDGFIGLRGSYDRLDIAMKSLHNIGRLAQDGLESEELFHLLGNFLKCLESSQRIRVLYMHYEIRLLQQQGVLPQQNMFQLFANTTLAENAKISLSEEDYLVVQEELRPFVHNYLT